MGGEIINSNEKETKKKELLRKGKREALLRIHRVEMNGGAGQIEKNVMEPWRVLKSSRNHISLRTNS